jgi:uncharacterized membrane protein YoaK (UPF0700 family)
MTANGNQQAVDTRVRDRLLDMMTMTSGSVDAVSWFALGGVFSAAVTGDFALLGLRIAGARDFGPFVLAIIAFAVGIFISALVIKRYGDSGMWPRGVTPVLALALIPHAFVLAVWAANRGLPSGDVARVLLGLWALAMGMQSGCGRALRVGGIYTTAITATLVVLISDIAYAPGAVEKWRRLASVLLSSLIGVIVGGVLVQHARVFAPAFPFLMTLAAVTTATLAFGKGVGTPDQSGVLPTPTGGHA